MMRILILVLIPISSFAQIKHEIKRPIGRYLQIEIDRSVYDDGDTLYFLSYKNAKYTRIVDMCVLSMKRNDLINFQTALAQLIDDKGDGQASIELPTGLRLVKEKNMGFNMIGFWKEGKYIYVSVKKAKVMRDDVLKEINKPRS